jgi:hypothetical protein
MMLAIHWPCPRPLQKDDDDDEEDEDDCDVTPILTHHL